MNDNKKNTTHDFLGERAPVAPPRMSTSYDFESSKKNI